MGDIRTELRAVGLARRNSMRTGEEVQQRVRNVTLRAADQVPKAEIARLLQIDRSTVYRLLSERASGEASA